MAKKKDLLNSPVSWMQIIFIFVILFAIFIGVLVIQRQSYRDSSAYYRAGRECNSHKYCIDKYNTGAARCWNGQCIKG